MRGTKKVENRESIIVNPESVRRLADELIEENDKIRITIWCADGTILYPASIDELLRFPNPKTREIQTINLSTPNHGRDSSWEIWLSNTFLSPASYTVWGEESYIVATADRIEKHFESMASSGLSFFSPSYQMELLEFVIILILGIPLAFIGLLACWAILVDNKPLYLASSKVGDLGSALMLISGIALILVAIKLERLQRHFFPKVAFCIGDGEVRYKRMIETRKLFGLGALVALLISIFASWIANMLPTR
jgi:hypothetical protein